MRDAASKKRTLQRFGSSSSWVGATVRASDSLGGEGRVRKEYIDGFESMFAVVVAFVETNCSFGVNYTSIRFPPYR